MGDTIYPYTAIHLDCIGSNCADYVHTIQNVLAFFTKVKGEPFVEDNEPLDSEGTVPSAVEAPPAVPPASSVTYSPKVLEFLSVFGLSADSLSFNPDTLLALCDNNTEIAVSFYLNNIDSIDSICPPERRALPVNVPAKLKEIQISYLQLPFDVNKEVRLSCGHVEANLDTAALTTMKDAMDIIKSGAVPPNNVDGIYGEYNIDQFTIVMPTNAKW